MSKKINVIGISDSHRQLFQPCAAEIIRHSKVFSGGSRHHEIMQPHIGKDSVWIDITVPLDPVFYTYQLYDEITVFASGDPLFYGFAATLIREFPDADISVFPSFNSLQTLAHRINLPYQDMVNVSLTGRPWKNLDDALISGHPLIGCLTDRKKGPAEIARRMLDYGYTGYSITVGTSLGNEEEEKVEKMSLQAASSREFSNPNCVILQHGGTPRQRYFGIPEGEFHHLEGRHNMITKMPVRLLSLAMLDLHCRKSFWDIGFCTGSISIEARLHFPHLAITSFEIREESLDLMELNCRKFGTPSITAVIGDFLLTDLSEFPAPDAVFIGGHGGKLPEMIQILKRHMKPDCVIVFNSVSTESCDLFSSAVKDIGKKVTERHNMALDFHNPITILKAQ